MLKYFKGLPLVAAAIAVSVVVSGCSGSGGGFLGINPGPSGNITITDAVSGAALTTSASKPYLLAGPTRFSIGISETDFGGPYSVTNDGVVNVPTQQNGGLPYPYAYSQPCFVPHFQNDPHSQTNVWTFSADNANGNAYAFPNGPPSGSTASAGNPCHSGELETWAISDSKGHTTLFFVEES